MGKDKANSKSKSFYQKIRKHIRRYDPFEFGLIASEYIRKSLSARKNGMRLYPPHLLLNGIEVSCLYFDKNVKRELDLKRFENIVNIYKDFINPYDQHELDKENAEGLFNFLVVEARNQYPLQRELDYKIFSRSVLLFSKTSNLKSYRDKFQSEYNLSIDEWIILCFSIFSLLIGNNQLFFIPENILDSEIEQIPKDKLTHFLKLSSLTNAEVAKKIQKEFDSFQPFLWIFIRSIFFEYPFLNCSGKYLCPHPNLLSFLACEKLHILLSNQNKNEFYSDFGNTFENYVKSLLSDLDHVIISNENETRSKYNISNGEICDFVVEFSDCFLLIETKAIQFTRRIVNLEYLAKSNSSKKISKAYNQLLSTTKSIHKKANKPIYALCITFGQLFFPNQEIYVNTVIIPNIDKSLLKFVDHLSMPIQTLSIDAFEMLLEIIEYNNFSPLELFTSHIKINPQVFQFFEALLSPLYSSIEKTHNSILQREFKDFLIDHGLKQAYDRSIKPNTGKQKRG